MGHKNLKTRTLLAIILSIQFLGSGKLSALTLFSRPDGTWSEANGGVDCNCVPQLNDGINVNHSISIIGPFTLNNGSFVINSPATLTINGDLILNNNSVLLVNAGAGLNVQGNFENRNNSSDITINGSLQIDNNFQNGQGEGTGAVITFGPLAMLTYGGSCSNPGTIIDFSGSYTGCLQGLLPVELLLFKSENKDEGVGLQWATASEFNFDKFVVERASEQLIFDEIGEITGKGSSKEIVMYQFTDHAPVFGVNYYRLRMVDLDGTENYSHVVTEIVKRGVPFSIYPIPGNGHVLHYFASQVPCENSRIIIYDNLGNELQTLKVTGFEGSLEFNPLLSSGLYTVKYVTCQDKEAIILKMIVN